ncbi:MAG: helix-turn-helix domain-containing protein [Steroidobacteraceae bacterium]
MTEAAHDRRLAPWGETEARAGGHAAAVAAWASSLPLDQIPSVLALLASRLVSEGPVRSDMKHYGANGPKSESLLTAGQLAERLNVPESWVRSEQRARRIPSQHLGKYVRFKLGDVERALAERRRQRP